MYGKQGAFLKSDGGWRGRRGRGEDWTAVAMYPPHCADLELMFDQAFVYIFPVHFSTVYTSCLRLHRDTFGVTDVHSTRAAEGMS